MKKFLIKLFSILLVLSFILSSSVITGYGSKTSAEIETITFGSYPQSKVTDKSLIESLEKLPLKWESYDYYSGTDVYDDGQMMPSDYMRYADVEYNSEKYRAVTFDAFRPSFTGYQTSADAETYQDNNGYCCNQIYWFKFEQLIWRVIDDEKGYVVCESVIDSQPFSNFLYFNGTAYYMDDKGYDYANYYVNSSIRNWLNTSFANTAFTEEEKQQILPNYMDDFWKDIEDYVFLPSANEMKNTEYWKDDSSRIAYGTDYAECQGLFTEEGGAYWRLRNAADWSNYDCAVSPDGTMYSYDYYYRVYSYQTAFTGTGIRPAIKLGKLSDNGFRTVEQTVYVSGEAEREMTFIEKVTALFTGIKDIAKYYFTKSEGLEEKSSAVMDSLGKGINVPCMEDGWSREWALEKSTYENIRNEGFDYIRLPANLVCMLDSNGTFNESAANCLDRTLKYAMDAGLSVILDLHGWQDLNNDPSAENIETIVSVWKQIAERYKNYPSQLMFEIYNEPDNSSGKMSNIRWNYVQNKVTAAIRNIDKDRIIVLSPMNYNVSSSLADLCYKHKDSYIVIDVHDYSPMEFTHQGAEWVDGYDEKVAYTEEAKNDFADAIRTAAEFKNKYGTKVIIGEFGVYLKQADKEDVSAFLRDAVSVMKENDLPWAYWEYYAGFGAYDCETKQWKDYVIDGLMS